MQLMSTRQIFTSCEAFFLLLLLSALAQPAAKAETNGKEVAARTCQQVSSCEEAVILWCNGYRRADRDNDGIPCENVCSTREQVNEIRRIIGC
ncbi:MAG: excalibur calcium-binding domain-containing protein [Rhizobium sp.]|nr:excalibur calcium-binding domain-containing protein [Rhizobium sp.]